MNERDIFIDALQIEPPADRQAFLDQACGGDSSLHERVETLLQAHEKDYSFLEAPPPGVNATIQLPVVTEQPGTVIGRYKLKEQIGEGGMGVVYVAEQTEPVRRKVALKIIKPGMDTRQVIGRFEAERQALALMDHPNIARVLDAGATESGRPYFVMELVRGMPITDYCDQAKLTTDGRLELFSKVCQAVQHAHQKGIIHRDIKPSNVMVTLHDGVPVPKVIDFGVAKAIGQRLTEESVYTQLTEMIGTPLYMSPEQAELSSLDVDTRSDVYSLGVLLYELLTGNTPFDRATLRAAGFDEIRRIIREEEPPKPSDRLGTVEAASLSTISEQRAIDPRKLTHMLRGDLDWIVMKALEKDRTRRYEAASALAADVSRHLADEPIEACPPSRIYRFRKFVRRNKTVMTTVSIAMLALIFGLTATTWQAIRATKAESEARHQQGRAEAQRERAQKNLRMAMDAVDHIYLHYAETNFTDFRGTNGQLTPEGEEFLKKALQFYEGFAEANRDDLSVRQETVRAYIRVARIRRSLGMHQEEVAAGDQAVKTARALFLDFPGVPEYRTLLVDALCMRGDTYHVRGERDIAIADYNRAIRIEPENIEPRYKRAVAFLGKNDFDKAMAAFAEVFRLDPKHARNYVSRGDAHFIMGNLDKALTDFNQAIRLDPEYARAHQLRARVFARKREYDKALEGFTKAIQFDSKSTEAAESFAYRGVEYMRRGEFDKAIDDYTEVIRLRPNAIQPYLSRADAYIKGHEFDKAAADFSESIRLQPDTAYHWYMSILAQLGAGRIDGYRSSVRQMLDHFSHTEDADNAFWVAWTCGLAPEAVADFSTPVALARKAVESDPKSPMYLHALGAVLYRAGEFDEAIQRLTEADQLMQDPDEESNSSPAYTWFFLAMAHQAHGQGEEAKKWFEKAVAWTDKALEEDEKMDGAPLAWNRRLTLKLFRAEAETRLMQNDE